MELIALWRMFWRRWYLILLPAVVVAALTAPELVAAIRGGGGGWNTVMRFTAAQPTSGDEPTYEDSGYMPWLASEYVVHALADWVRTGSFAVEVSEGLAARGVEIEAAALAPAFAADNARSVMQVFISWPDPDQLRTIAEVVVEVLQNRGRDYFPQFAAQSLQVIPLDGIGLAPTAPSLMDRFKPFLKIVLGLAAGIALAALVEYLDDSIRRRADLDTLAVPILGEIPRYRGG